MHVQSRLQLLRQPSQRPGWTMWSADRGGREGLQNRCVSPQEKDGGSSLPGYVNLRDFRCKISCKEILTAVAHRSGLTVDDLRGPVRAQGVAMWRQIAHALCRDLTSFSFPQIGSAVNRDHTTLLNSLKRVEHYRQSDPQIDAIYKDLRSQIQSTLK